jgi:hypothetical protein
LRPVARPCHRIGRGERDAKALRGDRTVDHPGNILVAQIAATPRTPEEKS